MKKYLLLILLNLSVYAQNDTARLGIYINSLHDFNISDKSFVADFWLWFNYANDSLVFKDAVDIPGSKSVNFTSFSIEKKNNVNWCLIKGSAVIKKDWDVTKFPFDKQKLTIQIEHSFYDVNGLKIIPDKVNSKIESNLILNEWKIDSLVFSAVNHTYNTTYGDPVLKGTSTYPSAIAEIYIERNHSWSILFKMLTGVYIAFLIVLLAFFIKPNDRLGLCVGGLFAVVGNKYIVESIVPSTISNTLFDSIHNLTFIYIFAVLVIAVISFKWQEKETEAYTLKAKKLDRISFYTAAISYIILNVILINRAIG